MPRALNLLREATHYRKACFTEGLQRLGFDVVGQIDRPEPGDLVLTWNAYGHFGDEGRRFYAAGATHLVVENGPLGKEWNGGEWFSLARNAVALTGGGFFDHGPTRWSQIGVELEPWHRPGTCVILGQRGIGAPGVASPAGWAQMVHSRMGYRVRPHPGRQPSKTLREDLAEAGEAITWSSAAAVQALAMGVPVWHAHPDFVMRDACFPLPLSYRWERSPRRDYEARLAAFRRLAWCMWTLAEIRTGEPIRCLLDA